MCRRGLREQVVEAAGGSDRSVDAILITSVMYVMQLMG
jgi:hypothetical protein